MSIKKQKGVAEMISETLIILIVIAVVGIILAILTPAISTQQSIQRFETAQKNIQEIDSAIINVLGMPIDSVIEISISLNKQKLEVLTDENKVIISHIIKGDYFEEDIVQQIDSSKYNYKENNVVFSVLEYDNISFYRTLELENINQVRLYFKKKDKDVVEISEYEPATESE